MFERKSNWFSLDSFERISPGGSFQRGDNSEQLTRYRRFVSSAVRYLPPKQREVVFLYFSEELKMREIAARLGVDISTVSRRLGEAKRTLRQLAVMCEEAGMFPS